MHQAFALEVYSTLPHLRTLSCRLWPMNRADREDGLSEMVLKAITKQHLFDGSNLVGWLKVLLHNIKRDQCAKGFAKADKASRAEGPRLSYVDPHVGQRDEQTGHVENEGYADHMADLCDPEAILLAKEHPSALKYAKRRVRIKRA